MYWNKSVAYDAAAKKQFHKVAHARLELAASHAGLRGVDYDLRSNMGGIAVSGEVTLHHDRVYVQVSQPCTGSDTGILIRRCQGRRDYIGGRNHFLPLSQLDSPRALGQHIANIMYKDR